MRIVFAIAVAVAVLAAAGPAAAQDPPHGVPYADLYFQDELIEQSLLRPDLDRILAGRRPVYSSLIKIRNDFVQEMLKTGEAI